MLVQQLGAASGTALPSANKAGRLCSLPYLLLCLLATRVVLQGRWSRLVGQTGLLGLPLLSEQVVLVVLRPFCEH